MRIQPRENDSRLITGDTPWGEFHIEVKSSGTFQLVDDKGQNVGVAKVVIKAPKGVGDVVADSLAKIGVKHCGGCKERQALLNRLGCRISRWLQKVIERIIPCG